MWIPSINEPVIHFFGGAIGGTCGTCVTCPLEVIKTRLQSSHCKGRTSLPTFVANIIAKEGVGALYKGLLPNLIGVTPSKAAYFCTYSTSKRMWNESGYMVPDSALVHMTSALLGGFVTASVINPVWLVKTRLQLHQGRMGVFECIGRIWKKEGPKGFYKGVTASYMGISETMIQFVLYEQLRAMVEEEDKDTKFYTFMLIGGIAKFCACVITYPHEVVRTRLREEDSKAKGLINTFGQLFKEGGFRSLYRGLSVQLMRSVPNTAITMATYEMVIYLLHGLKERLDDPNSATH
ncbi:mitochondrial carrier protein domain-containing protein [Ditylenchus destructor]|uniref:Mitochondrial carrier protein domain-containing protein n=1 Tax=Ditylenchus destructor TaxID=166010 RepID=A0AAD4MVE7_9BILA|nr:mitochondrial carrier protein domain-containing protein [Ditylenchus destructor]